MEAIFQFFLAIIAAASVVALLTAYQIWLSPLDVDEPVLLFHRSLLAMSFFLAFENACQFAESYIDEHPAFHILWNFSVSVGALIAWFDRQCFQLYYFKRHDFKLLGIV